MFWRVAIYITNKLKVCGTKWKNAAINVIRLGDLLHFGQLSKHVATIILPKLPTFFCKFWKGEKVFKVFLWNNFWAILIDIWQLFTGHTGWRQYTVINWIWNRIKLNDLFIARSGSGPSWRSFVMEITVKKIPTWKIFQILT